jgi:antitoxin (DNA-binding transcriptional repressor) of toxin-antitoxin stability system
MASVTASALRQNIYAILDEALETGIPVEIQRKGRVLRIVPDKPRAKKGSVLDRLKKHDHVVGDLDDLIHIDWSKEWSELKRRKK